MYIEGLQVDGGGRGAIRSRANRAQARGRGRVGASAAADVAMVAVVVAVVAGVGAGACAPTERLMVAPATMFEPALPYPQEIAADGALGHWRLDGPVRGAIAGDVDGALVFTGQTHRLLEAPEFGGAEATVEVWVSAARGGAILSYAVEGGLDRLAVACDGAGQLVVTVLGAASKTGVGLCDGQEGWRHLGVTWRGEDGALAVTIEGQEVWRGVAGAGRELPRGGVVVLGQGQGCAGGCMRGGFVGRLDEVALHERALPESRLRSHALVGAGVRPATPIERVLPIEIQPQFSHTAAIRDLAFSPDERLLVTGDQEGVIKLWDVATGRLIRDLDRHKDAINLLGFTPDGRLLISASSDTTLGVWDVVTGALLHRLDAHTEPVGGFVIAPDGQRIISSGQDDTLRQWDLSTGRQRRELRAGAPEHALSMALDEDGRVFAAGLGKRVKVWEMASGALLHDVEAHEDVINGLAFSPDGRLLATASDDGSAALVDLQSGAVVEKFEEWGEARGESGEAPKVLSVAFEGGDLLALLEGGVLAVVSLKGQGVRAIPCCGTERMAVALLPGQGAVVTARGGEAISMWDLASGSVLRTYGERGFADGMVAVSGSRRLLAAVDGRGALMVWEVATGRLVRELGGASARPRVAIFSPDGRRAATDDQAGLWDLETGRLLRTFGVEGVTALAFSPDGALLALGGHDGRVSAFEPSTGRRVFSIQAHPQYVRQLAFSPDGALLASLSEGDAVRTWDLAGAARHVLSDEEGASVFAFDRKGGRLIVAAGEVAVIWGLEDGQVERRLEGHEALITAVAVSADGRAVVTASDDERLKVWGIEDGALMGDLALGLSEPMGLVVSPAGDQVVALGSDNHLTVIDPRAGALKANLAGHADTVNAAAFVPDGAGIWTASDDQTVRLWNRFGFVEKEIPLRARALSVDVSPDGRRLLVACEDRTLRLINLDTDVAVTMLSHDSSWLAFTAAGHFDASPGGAALVSMVQGSRVFGVDQRALTHNRPDKLIEGLGLDRLDPESLSARTRARFEARMAALGIDRAALDRQRQRLDGLRRHFLARYRRRLEVAGLPEENVAFGTFELPEARILQARPGDDPEVAVLELAFRSRKALSSFQIYVNDVPVFAAPRPLSGQQARVTEVIALTEGVNKIEVAARNTFGLESLRALATLDRAPGERRGDLIFIGFGVSDYLHDEELPDLQYAHQDALDLARYFQELGESDDDSIKKFDGVRVHVFTDAQVTPAQIEAASGLLSSATAQDTLILFVAGHGVRGDDEARTYYYLTHGARLDDLPGTAAPFEAIERLLFDSKPRKKLFLMDTCQSGEIDEDAPAAAGGGAGARGLAARAVPMSSRTARVFGGEPGGEPGGQPGALAPLVDRERFIYVDLARRSGAIVLSSSRGQEYSLEGPQFENGAFTEVLLQALRSEAADGDGDGLVTTDELREHAIRAVPLLTDDRQHPTVDRDNLFQKFALPVLRPAP